jgi:hypothetical protein
LHNTGVAWRDMTGVSRHWKKRSNFMIAGGTKIRASTLRFAPSIFPWPRNRP